MSVSWTEFALMLVMYWLVAALFVLCISVLGAVFGLTVKEGKVGFGPRLLRLNWFGGTLDFGLIPFASYVAFWGHDEMDRKENWDGLGPFDLSATRQVALNLSGPVAHLLLGILVAYVFPGREGTLLGSIGIWMGATSLLPLPGTCGYFALRALTPRRRRRPSEDYSVGIALAAMFFLMLLNVAFYFVLLFRSEWILQLSAALAG